MDVCRYFLQQLQALLKLYFTVLLFHAGYSPGGLWRNKVTSETKQHSQSGLSSGKLLSLSPFWRHEIELSAALISSDALSLVGLFMAIFHSLLLMDHCIQTSSFHNSTAHVELEHRLMTLMTSEVIQPLNTPAFLGFGGRMPRCCFRKVDAVHGNFYIFRIHTC